LAQDTATSEFRLGSIDESCGEDFVESTKGCVVRFEFSVKAQSSAIFPPSGFHRNRKKR
jgi:hypothetical protein